MKKKRSGIAALVIGILGVNLSSQGLAAPPSPPSPPSAISNRATPAWTLLPVAGENNCVLSTSLAPSASFQSATMVTSIGRKQMTVSLVGPPLKDPLMKITAGYQIGKGAVSTQDTFGVNTSAGDYVVTLAFKGAEADAIYNGAPLLVAVSKTTIVSLNTLGLWGGLAVADACQRRRFVEAGAPADVVKDMAVGPLGSITSLFTSSDYPLEAIRAGHQGTVSALAMIGADGRVLSCKVVKSSSSAALDQKACAVVKERGRFTAGLNRSGRPIDAPVFYRIRWELPSGRETTVVFGS